jgi:DNA-binding CsgD family transcriptional regulator
MLYIYNNYTQKQIQRQKDKLKEESKQINAMRELETKQQMTRLKNEQLQKDVESKNRELAVSTMSTLKRNEFLNTLKQKLQKVNDLNQVKELIKIINEKLNSNDDWEYFKKAFDNSDQAFFQKIKQAHPSLTNNDLKLCAYLRLNLSSKEIAPLLNISVHSVEIKRYRLRKKMALTRKQGIVEYILSF